MIGFQKWMGMGIVKEQPKAINAGGTRKVSLTLEIPNAYTDSQGNEKTATDYVKVTFWGKLAERIEFVSEGSWLYVEGKMRNESYEKDGKKVYVTFINASDAKVASEVPQAEVPY